MKPFSSDRWGSSALLVLVCVIVASQTGVWAQKLKSDADQRYLVLSTKKLSTMEKELDEAASSGFMVVLGAPTSTAEMGLFLERLATPEAPSKYQLLATSRVKTMEKELNEAAKEGFHVLAQTFISKKGMFTNEIVVVLERPPTIVKDYDYRLLAAIREKTIHKELAALIEEGYELIAMLTFGEHVLIMERARELGAE